MIKNKIPQISSWGWAIVVLLPIVITIAVVSYLTPIMEDDFVKGDGATWLALKDAWRAFASAYINIGGRVNNFIFGFFAYSFYRAPLAEDFSQMVLAVLNGLVFVGFLLALFFLAFAQRPKFNDNKDRLRIVIIFMLMMTILAEKGETIFWLNGRATYLWSTAILSWFAVFYRLAFAHHATNHFLTFNKKPSQHFFFTVAMVPLAVVAGMTDYIGVVIVSGLIAFGFIYNIFFGKQRLPLWCYIVFIFFIIGFVTMVAAPGNQGRLLSAEYAGYQALPLLKKIFHHPWVGFRIFLHETFLLPILIWPMLYYWQRHIVARDKNPVHRMIKKMRQDKNFAMAVIYLLASFGFAAVMAISPANYSRVWFAATALFLLACVLVVDFFLFSPVKKNIFIKKYIFYIPTLIFSLYLLYIVTITIGFRQEFNTMVASVINQKEQGKETIIIKPYSQKYIYSRFGAQGFAFWNWEALRSEWGLGAMANYYGVKKIVIEK